MRPQEKLALLFGLRYDDKMQDWELQVADPRRVSEFLDCYENNDSLEEADRLELMRLVIASYDDLLNEKNAESPDLLGAKISATLLNDYPLHEETIEYWASGSENDCFSVRPLMLLVKKAASSS